MADEREKQYVERAVYRLQNALAGHYPELMKALTEHASINLARELNKLCDDAESSQRKAKMFR